MIRQSEINQFISTIKYRDLSNKSSDYFGVYDLEEKAYCGNNSFRLNINYNNLVDNSRIYVEVIDSEFKLLDTKIIPLELESGARFLTFEVNKATAKGIGKLRIAGQAKLYNNSLVSYSPDKNVPNLIYEQDIIFFPDVETKDELYYLEPPTAEITSRKIRKIDTGTLNPSRETIYTPGLGITIDINVLNNRINVDNNVNLDSIVENSISKNPSPGKNIYQVEASADIFHKDLIGGRIIYDSKEFYIFDVIDTKNLSVISAEIISSSIKGISIFEIIYQNTAFDHDGAEMVSIVEFKFSNLIPLSGTTRFVEIRYKPYNAIGDFKLLGKFPVKSESVFRTTSTLTFGKNGAEFYNLFEEGYFDNTGIEWTISNDDKFVLAQKISPSSMSPSEYYSDLKDSLKFELYPDTKYVISSKSFTQIKGSIDIYIKSTDIQSNHTNSSKHIDGFTYVGSIDHSKNGTLIENTIEFISTKKQNVSIRIVYPLSPSDYNTNFIFFDYFDIKSYDEIGFNSNICRVIQPISTFDLNVELLFEIRYLNTENKFSNINTIVSNVIFEGEYPTVISDLITDVDDTKDDIDFIQDELVSMETDISDKVNGTGTATRVAFWSGNKTLSSNANLYWDNINSRLGIGTSTPAYTLDINGPVGVRSTSGIQMYDSGGWGGGRIYSSYSWDNGDIFIHPFNSVTPSLFSPNGGLRIGASAVRPPNNGLNVSGNVAINIDTPTAKVHAVGESLSGSSSTGTILAQQTWNTTGTPSLIKGSVTNTASTFGRLIDFEVGGTTAITIPALNGAIYFGNLLLSNGSAIGASNPSTGGFLMNGNAVSLAHRVTGSNIGYGVHYTVLTGTRQATSGESGNQLISETFNPTSGTAIYNGISISNTINQTGGANGVTRGLYINPTITAAFGFRGIELTNNSGHGIYQSGTAKNYFSGNVGIGIDPTVKLDVNGDSKINGYTLGRGGGNIISNIVFGYEALANNTTGYTNTAIGYRALKANTTQYGNTAVGYGAMEQATSIVNTAIGVYALRKAGSTGSGGIQNTAIGQVALSALTTGIQNVAIGEYAGQNLTEGNYNTLIGTGVGTSITTGGQNLIVGSLAGQSLTTQGGNVGIGVQAMRFATTSSSIAIGNQILAYATSNNHVAIGGLFALTSGASSTAVGISALASATTGGYNTAVGWRAGWQGNGSNNIFLGNFAGAYETGTYKLLIGSVENYSESVGRSSAIIHGTMSATSSSQVLDLNAKVKVTYKPDGPNTIAAYDSNGYFAEASLGDNLYFEDGSLNVDLNAFTWVSVTAGQTMDINTGYILNDSGLKMTLPDTCNPGDIIKIVSNGYGLFELYPGSGQTIVENGSNSTTSRVDSTDNYDTIELICTIANDRWIVNNKKGSYTYS